MGLAFCALQISERVGAFALKLCIATNLFAADTRSLGENVVLLAGPWPHVLDSVSGCLSAQPIEGAAVTDLVENIGHLSGWACEGHCWRSWF